MKPSQTNSNSLDRKRSRITLRETCENNCMFSEDLINIIVPSNIQVKI